MATEPRVSRVKKAYCKHDHVELKDVVAKKYEIHLCLKCDNLIVLMRRRGKRPVMIMDIRYHPEFWDEVMDLLNAADETM